MTTRQPENLNSYMDGTGTGTASATAHHASPHVNYESNVWNFIHEK